MIKKFRKAKMNMIDEKDMEILDKVKNKLRIKFIITLIRVQ